jgi:hypothetical protein
MEERKGCACIQGCDEGRGKVMGYISTYYGSIDTAYFM